MVLVVYNDGWMGSLNKFDTPLALRRAVVKKPDSCLLQHKPTIPN